ncbi:MAG: ester cyclase, partial [Acidimicrobiia bacterium]
RDFVRRIFEEGWNGGSFECLEGATAPSVLMHYNGASMRVTPDSLPHLVGEWRSAFPDLEMRIRHLVADGDLVAASLSVHGTHRGDWRGLPASGTVVAVEEMMFFRFEDGLLVEMWEVFDEAGMSAQLRGP